MLIFRPGSLLTTFDLTSRGYYDEPVLRQTIEKPLNDGRVGQYRASPVGFAFRSFSGKHLFCLGEIFCKPVSLKLIKYKQVEINW